MARREGAAHNATARKLHAYVARFMKGFRQKLRLLGSSIVSPAGVLCCNIILWMAMFGIGTSSLMASRGNAFNQAVQNSRNLTLVLEHDMRRSIDQYDLSLRAAAEGVADKRVMSLPTNMRSLVLFDRAATGRYLGSITVRAADGRLLADSVGRSDARDDRGDAHQALAGYQMTPGGLYIGHPVRFSLGDGPLAIALGRAITGPDGTVLGSVVGSLSLEYFDTLINRLSIGEKGAVIVIETDGTLIARLPYSSANIGRSLAHAPIFQHFMGGQEGYFVASAKLDGVRRLYVYRRLPGLPLIVAVAPAMNTVYAEWWTRVGWFAALIFVFTAIQMTGVWLFVYELRRRQRAEAFLERMAHRDSLTGLENRGTFDAVLKREWTRTRRHRNPLSLLFIDIDRFKTYNDHYGHQAGDIALKAVATRISECIDEPWDHVARYGGEEFVVVLPDTDTAGAILVAERIRRSVLDLHVEHAQTAAGFLTVSVGASSTTDATVTDAVGLLKAADAALYEAKGLGRNRVAVAQELDAELIS